MMPLMIIGLLLALVFLVLLSVSLGRSITLMRLFHEQNRKRQLELDLLAQKSEILKHGKQIAHDLEQVLFTAQVQKEIEDMTRKNDNR